MNASVDPLLSAKSRFAKYVEVTDTCHVWRGYLHKGYGSFKVNGKMVYAFRWNYEQLNGPIAKGLVLDHLCRNRACVNPAHLEPVTPRENLMRGEAIERMRAMKRAITHCPQGHPYSQENTYIGTKGERHCRECNRVWNRRRYDKRRHPKQPKEYCPQGHPYDAENTLFLVKTKAKRCRTCQREKWKAFYRKKSEEARSEGLTYWTKHRINKKEVCNGQI